MKTSSTSLPVAGLRKYFASQIRLRRSAIRKAPMGSSVALIRKEMLEAQLSAIRFAAKDIAYFGENPEILS